MGSTTQPDLCEACTGGLKNASTLCPECGGTASRKERARLAGDDVQPKPEELTGKISGDSDGSDGAKESGDSENEDSKEAPAPAK